MRTADRYCDVAGFDPETNDAVFFAHDASECTLVEVEGARTIVSDDDYLTNVVTSFAGGIGQVLKHPGHSITRRLRELAEHRRRDRRLRPAAARAGAAEGLKPERPDRRRPGRDREARTARKGAARTLDPTRGRHRAGGEASAGRQREAMARTASSGRRAEPVPAHRRARRPARRLRQARAGGARRRAAPGPDHPAGRPGPPTGPRRDPPRPPVARNARSAGRLMGRAPAAYPEARESLKRGCRVLFRADRRAPDHDRQRQSLRPTCARWRSGGRRFALAVVQDVPEAPPRLQSADRDPFWRAARTRPRCRSGCACTSRP